MQSALFRHKHHFLMAGVLYTHLLRNKDKIGRMEGLRGKPVRDICLEYQISQTQYYLWRDKLMNSLPQVFASTSRKEEAQAREITRLKEIIGELTVELKKAISGTNSETGLVCQYPST